MGQQNEWFADYPLNTPNDEMMGGHHMKKTLVFIITSIVLVLFCGCSEEPVKSNNNQEPTTTYVMEVRSFSIDHEDPVTKTTTTQNSTKATSTSITEHTIESESTTAEETVRVTETTVVETTEIQSLPEPETVAVQNAVLQYATYTVQEGDWLSKIADSYGIDMYTLAQFNNMSVEDTILPGDKLLIPSGYTLQYDYSYDEPTYYEPDYSYNNQSSSYSDGLVHYGCDTKYSSAGWASFHNMEVASNVLTYQVAYIPPGGDFSWLRDVGPCTSDPYVEAGAYNGNEVISATGGGICMTASALRVAADNAGCVVTVANTHSMEVSYNPRSYEGWEKLEAAIDSSGCDLCFYNPSSTTGLTIRVYTDINSGSCTAELIPDN